MIKLADIGGLIWVIIIVMITVAKGWSKLQESKESQSPEPDDAPPPVRPRPPISRPQPRPASVPAPRMPRPAPPVMRRPATQSAAGPIPSARKVSADDIRRVVEQMGRKPQATVPPPPLPRPEPALPPPLPEPPEASAPKQTIADAPAPAKSSRATQWTEALRDRQNIRNIIISYEIIGPPRAESV